MPFSGERGEKNQEKEGEPSLARIYKQVPTPVKLAFLLAMLGTPKVEAKPAEPSNTEAVIDQDDQKSGVKAEIAGSEKSGWMPESVEGDFTFIEKGEDGEMRFNPWSILSPVQLDVAWKRLQKGTDTVTIPYEYARAFDTAKPLNPEDYAKAEAYLRQQLERIFAERLIAFDMSERVYRRDHAPESLSQMKIQSIKFLGAASPEAEKYGPSSIEPGHVEPENLELAEMRAMVGRDITIKQLSDMGVDKEALDKALTNMSVESQELQFSAEELRELATLAVEYKGVDEVEKIDALISAYNKGQIKDAAITQRLDEIVAKKRMVQVEIVYENDAKSVLIIPLPLLLLLGLLWPPRRGGFIDIPPRGRTLPPQGEAPVPPEGVVLGPDDTERITEDGREILGIPGSEIPTDLAEREKMQDATLVNDIYMFFDRPETVARGLDYRAIADDFFNHYDQLTNEQDREAYLTAKILAAWRLHDLGARREAGISSEALEEGLDYAHQPKQIQWARIHARELIQLVELRRQNNDRDYLDLVSPRVRIALQRQTFKQQK